MNAPFLLFDIGGSKTRIAVSVDGKTFNDPVIIDTPSEFDDGINQIEEIARKAGNSFGGVVGGIAGPLDKNKTMVVNAPNLKGWNLKPLKQELENRFKAPAIIENDVALIGLGEALEGTGKGYEIVAYMTVSTGVNGVRIVRGKIDNSALGFEMGHQILDFDKTSFEGDFESMVSGKALESKYKIDPKDITDPKVWEEEAKLVAYGLNNLILFWSPNVVVVGGSVSQKLDINKVSENLREINTIFPELPEIKMSELDSLGGLHGALHYAKLLS